MSQHKFRNLGSTLTSDDRCNTEIKQRIARPKRAFSDKIIILTEKKTSMETKNRFLKCHIQSVMLSGCEAWTVSNKMKIALMPLKCGVIGEY